MKVMKWVVQELLKDSECCGSCFGCMKQFAQCTDVEEVVE